MSLLLILLMQLMNRAQFLNVAPLFLPCACLAANNCASVLSAFGFGFGPASPVIVIAPITNMYA